MSTKINKCNCVSCVKTKKRLTKPHVAAVLRLNTRGQPRTEASPGGIVFLNPVWTRLPGDETAAPAAAELTHGHNWCLLDLVDLSPEARF